MASWLGSSSLKRVYRVPALAAGDIVLCSWDTPRCIQLFRQRLFHKSIKAYATMPIGIMGRKILALID